MSKNLHGKESWNKKNLNCNYQITWVSMWTSLRVTNLETQSCRGGAYFCEFYHQAIDQVLTVKIREKLLHTMTGRGKSSWKVRWARDTWWKKRQWSNFDSVTGVTNVFNLTTKTAEYFSFVLLVFVWSNFLLLWSFSS